MGASLKKSSAACSALFLVVLTIASLSCVDQPLEPILPTWDTQLTFPVINRFYTLDEFAEENPSELGVLPGETRLVFNTSATTEPVFVNDLLRLDPINANASVGLGSFDLAPVTMQLPITIPGVTTGLPLPPLSSTAVPSVGVSQAEFQEVSLESGTLRVTLRNNLPATIRLETPIELRNASDIVITTITFVPDSIPAGTERSATGDLAGATLTGTMSVAGATVSSPGSLQPVPPGDHLVATLYVDGLVAQSATLASIPPQTLVDNAQTSIVFDDSTKVQEAIVGSGSLFLNVQSGIDLNAAVTIRFLEILHPDGTPYQDSVLLLASGQRDKSIDLAGLHIRSQDGGLISAFEVQTSVDMYEGSAGRTVTVSSTDQIGISANSSNIVVDSIVGIVKPLRVSVDEAVATDLGDLSSKFSGQLVLPSAEMRFSPLSSIQFPLELDLQLEGRNTETGARSFLQVTSAKGGTGLDVIEFNPVDVGAFISELAGGFPDSMRVNGIVDVNPSYDTGTLGRAGKNSSVGGVLDITIPLTLSIPYGLLRDTTVIGDTTGDGVADRQIDENTLERVQDGEVFLEVENGLPVALNLKVGLLDRAGRVLLWIPQAPGDSVVIPSAIMSQGNVQAPTMASTSIFLTQEELRHFNLAELVTFAIGLQTAQGEVVNFRTSDSVRIRSWVQLSYRMDP
jgi:hypothetical protein